MGMFDYIRCEVPLPDGWQASNLQTKDFDCAMVEHVITKDGRLMMDIGHDEMVPLAERPSWKAEWGFTEEAEKEHPWEAMRGCLRHIKKHEDANFHGVVNFYGNETIGYEPAQPGDQFRRPIYRWHEYNAKFTDGQLVGIEVVTDDEPVTT